MKNIKNKILLAIIFFLFMGMYVDIRMMRKDESICVKEYRQRALIIQTVVPFRPKRETFYLGVGNRHYDHFLTVIAFLDESNGEYLGLSKSESGCAIRYQELIKNGGHSFFHSHYHYINLNLTPVREAGVVKIEDIVQWLSEEDYKRWYK